jgi:cytochrome c peroxidase
MTRISSGRFGLGAGALLIALVGCTPKDAGPAPTGTSGAGIKPDYNKLPLGLDPFQRKGIDVTAEQPIAHELVELGRHLYFDKRLSADESISCATCHDPDKGWTDQAAVSTGIKGLKGGRSAPTVINRVFSDAQFWDGRSASLEDQAKGPMTNPIEMGMSDHEPIVAKVSKIAGYAPYFKAAFGDEKVDIDRIAKAIAMFERTIVAGNSPFDRFQNGEKTALSESAARGSELFKVKARCSICHSGSNFTNEDYHNIGVGMSEDGSAKDTGREQFTKNIADRGKFKTPTLRNLTQTAPYMHDGSETTLAAVVEYYDKGGTPNPYLDKEMKPLGLTDSEKADLIAFLEALTGEVTKVTRPTPLE